MKFGLEYLPESFDGTDVHRELLTVSGIPVDSLCGEAIAVEICWGEGKSALLPHSESILS